MPSLPIALERFLFDPHWAIFVGWAVAVGVALVVARQWQPRRGLVAAGVLLALAVAHAVAAWLVATPEERVLGAMRSFIEATQRGEAAEVRRYFADDLVLTDQGGALVASGPETADDLAAAVARLRPEHSRIADPKAQWQSPGRVANWLGLRTMLKGNTYQAPPGPYATSWRLVWERDDGPGGAGDWRIAEIAWLQFQQGGPPAQWGPHLR